MIERTVFIPELTAEAVGSMPMALSCPKLGGETMGTAWSAQFYAPQSTRVDYIEAELEASFGTIIADMSNWEENSAISRFNRLPAGSGMAVSGSFAHVLQNALKIAEQTEGAFNPCYGAYTHELAFSKVETADAESAANDDWRRLSFNGEENYLTQPGGVQLDLSALAKGFAVDEMARVLERNAISSYLVEVGGEFKGRGARHDGQPWWVSLDSKLKNHNFVTALCGVAVASSGHGERVRSTSTGTADHIVGSEPSDILSVSVFAETCMEADAWATALYAVGVVKGLAYANKQGLPALFQTEHLDPMLSNSLKEWLE